MNDREMAALFMAQLLPLFPTGVKLARNYQARQQGANTSSYVYFHKVTDRRYGSPERRDMWDEDAQEFVHTETQDYLTTYQFSAWVPQNPANVTELTESDILNTVSGIIQSDEIINVFRSNGVGILRVTDVRNPYILDDRDQFEAIPTFDVVLAHQRQRVTADPAITTTEFNFRRV